MLRNLKHSMIYVARRLLSVVRRLNKNQYREVLILPPASAGSLGDQALLQGCQDHLLENGQLSIRQLLLPGRRLISTRLPQLPPVFLSRSVTWRTLQLLFFSVKAKKLYVVGADVLDGRYNSGYFDVVTKISGPAKDMGVPVTILGCSYSRTPDERTVGLWEEFSHDVDVFARDPVSLEKIRASVCAEAQLSADVGFLMRPVVQSDSAREVLEWLKERRLEGAEVVALNFSGLNADKDEVAGVDYLVELLESFLCQFPNVCVLVLPHDFREGQSDLALGKSVIAQTIGKLLPRIKLLEPPFDAWDVKGIVANLDYVFTARMHLAVAAMGVGVPVYCYAYQEKFEGLFKHFGLDPNEMIYRLGCSAGVGPLVDDIKSVYSKRELTQSKIGKALGEVQKLSRRNFS
jgi:polysaccharide pyruvyl transferase WcaK-like protein